MGTSQRSGGYSVFISYRREGGGAETARLIQAELIRRGVRPFLDVDDLGPDHFDERLLREIENAPNFVVILSPECLEQCKHEGDWLRREIAHAISTHRNIVPILNEGFRFPAKESLPPDIADLPRYNGVKYSHSYFGAAIDKLLGFLQCTAVPESSGGDVRLSIDWVVPYREIRSGRTLLFGTVELKDGIIAHCEGQTVQLTLENRSHRDIVVTTVDVFVAEYEPDPIETYSYSPLEISSTHLEMPGSTLAEPLQLTEANQTGSAAPITTTRLLLRRIAGVESQHTLTFAVVARAAGIWRLRIRASYVDLIEPSTPRVAESEPLHLVKN